MGLVHDCTIVGLITYVLEVVFSELHVVKSEFNTGIVDHVLRGEHARGSTVGPEGSVTGRVSLASCPKNLCE